MDPANAAKTLYKVEWAAYKKTSAPSSIDFSQDVGFDQLSGFGSKQTYTLLWREESKLESKLAALDTDLEPEDPTTDYNANFRWNAGNKVSADKKIVTTSM